MAEISAIHYPGGCQETTPAPQLQDIQNLERELQSLQDEDKHLAEKKYLLELQRDQLKLTVEEAKSKQRLRSLAKHKAKLRKREELDAL